jgi:hypothetical protein
MLANKELISKVIFTVVFLFITVYVLGPVFFNFIKSKLPGYQQPEHDLDTMIKRQKERLRSQYGLVGRTEHEALLGPKQSSSGPQTHTIENLYKESRWGGGDFTKSIQTIITKNYSYTIAESKINAFILLAEKKNWSDDLSSENQNSTDAIKNFLSLIMLLKILIEEIREKDYNVLQKVAGKCKRTPTELALAIQFKLLLTISSKKNLAEEKIFTESPHLHQFSEETMIFALDNLIHKEANLWAKGHSLFLEELALYLDYAHMLQPIIRVANKKDTTGAAKILGVSEKMTIEEIKKVYKKMALAKHPDKIHAQKLPKPIEKQAIKNFTLIQEAYDILSAAKKVE